MKRLILSTLIVLSGCHSETPTSSVQDGANTIGHLRGNIAVTRDLVNAMLVDTGYFDITQVVDKNSYASGRLRGIALLMGAVAGVEGDREFRNTAPNSVNMLLWQTALKGFAETSGQYCQDSEDTQLDFHGTFSSNAYLSENGVNMLRALCGEVEGTNQLDAAKDLWMAIIGFRAPRAEYDAWVSFMETQLNEASDPVNVVSTALYTLLMNPYFLLEV